MSFCAANDAPLAPVDVFVLLFDDDDDDDAVDEDVAVVVVAVDDDVSMGEGPLLSPLSLLVKVLGAEFETACFFKGGASSLFGSPTLFIFGSPKHFVRMAFSGKKEIEVLVEDDEFEEFEQGTINRRKYVKGSGLSPRASERETDRDREKQRDE